MAKKDPYGEVNSPIKKKLIEGVSAPFHKQSVQKTREAIKEIKPPSKNKLSKNTVKRAIFSEEEAMDNDKTIESIGIAIGVPNLTYSHVDRAQWQLIRRASEAIELTKVKAPELKRPANADSYAVAQFEDELAEYLLVLLKETKRML